MTPADDLWLSMRDMEFLTPLANERLSRRKIRLLLCAINRLTWPVEGEVHPVIREAVVAYEEAADDYAKWHAMVDCLTKLKAVYLPDPHFWHENRAWVAAWDLLSNDLHFDYGPVVGLGEIITMTNTQAYKQSVDLFRDFLPNIFLDCPPLPAHCRTGDVATLAQAAYHERIGRGELDPVRLAILADALEETGCDRQDVLGHLRSTAAPHYRGCWALDLVLGKE